MDRRITKTRRMLQTALLDLLREKPFETIEIQAITERANTARVTFYRHYGTREELLLDVMEHIYQDMQLALGTISVAGLLDATQPPPCQVLFDYLAADRVLHKNLFSGSVSALIQQRVRHYVVQQVMLTFNAASAPANVPVTLIANHIATCIIGNVTWWLTEDLPYSAEYMARLSHWLGLAGVRDYMGHGDAMRLPELDKWATF